MSASAKLMSGKNYTKKVRKLQETHAENDACFVCAAPSARLVCSDFNIFVCQFCADIHSEFGHNIRSVLHSEWDAEGYAALKSGGNKAATSQWLAFWNQEDFVRPAHQDAARIKDFIRKAFVVKCWQRQPKKPPRKTTVMGTQPSAQAKASLDADDVPPFQGPTFEVNWDNLPPPESEGKIVPPDFNNIAAEKKYCRAHRSSENRPKCLETSVKRCQGCSLVVETNHLNLVYCPPCAVKLSRCLVCGDSVCEDRPRELRAPAGSMPGSFCGKHDSSDKREKGPIKETCCSSCTREMQTTYKMMAYCPPCAERQKVCMICGDPQAVLFLREPSEGHPSNQSNKSTEAPPTANGLDVHQNCCNGDGTASEDPDVLETAAPPDSAAAATAAAGAVESEHGQEMDQTKGIERKEEQQSQGGRVSLDDSTWKASFEDPTAGISWADSSNNNVIKKNDGKEGTSSLGGPSASAAAADLVDLLDFQIQAPTAPAADIRQALRATVPMAAVKLEEEAPSAPLVTAVGAAVSASAPTPSRAISEEEVRSTGSSGIDMPPVPSEKEASLAATPKGGVAVNFRLRPPPVSTSPLPGIKSHLALPPPASPGDEDLLGDAEDEEMPVSLPPNQTEGCSEAQRVEAPPAAAAAAAAPAQSQKKEAEAAAEEDPFAELMDMGRANANGGKSSSSSSFIPQDPFAELFTGGLFQKRTAVAVPVDTSRSVAPTLLQSKPTSHPGANWSWATSAATNPAAGNSSSSCSNSNNNNHSSNGSKVRSDPLAATGGMALSKPKEQEAPTSSFMPDDWLLEADQAKAKQADAFGDVMDAFHKVEKHFGEVKHHAGQAKDGAPPTAASGPANSFDILGEIYMETHC